MGKGAKGGGGGCDVDKDFIVPEGILDIIEIVSYFIKFWMEFSIGMVDVAMVTRGFSSLRHRFPNVISNCFIEQLQKRMVV